MWEMDKICIENAVSHLNAKILGSFFFSFFCLFNLKNPYISHKLVGSESFGKSHI